MYVLLCVRWILIFGTYYMPQNVLCLQWTTKRKIMADKVKTKTTNQKYSKEIDLNEVNTRVHPINTYSFFYILYFSSNWNLFQKYHLQSSSFFYLIILILFQLTSTITNFTSISALYILIRQKVFNLAYLYLLCLLCFALLPDQSNVHFFSVLFHVLAFSFIHNASFN